MVTAAVAPAGARENARALPASAPAALVGWMAAVVIVCLFAVMVGSSARATATAAVLALAPAVATLLLASRWSEKWARAIALDSWIAAAAAAVAVTGGVASPAAAAFAIAPAAALRFEGPARAAEATALCVLAFAVAAALAAVADVRWDAPAPGAFTVLSLAFAGWLVAAPRATSVRPAPSSFPREEAEPDASRFARRFAEAAHELRTPLGHITGFAEIMQRQMFGPLPAKYAEYVDLILDSARRMTALATDWLDLGRLDAGRYTIVREPVDLAELVRDAAEAARLAASARRQSVRTSGADSAAPFNADPRAVRQILDNLLANAVKFTPEGGDIVARLIVGPNAAVLDVEDNGPGLPAADKARLGRAFERGPATAAAEGAGLGLALVGALAEAHGGRLDMLDAEGGGALMRVILPAAPAD